MEVTANMVLAFVSAAQKGDLKAVTWHDHVQGKLVYRAATLVAAEVDEDDPTTVWASYDLGDERFSIELGASYCLRLQPNGKLID